MGLIAGGYVPNPLHEVHEYMPTTPEVIISLGVYAIGALILTVLYKIVAGVKEETYA
jgi:molybdopterin-containing oxidoreductase family membrane subunit